MRRVPKQLASLLAAAMLTAALMPATASAVPSDTVTVDSGGDTSVGLRLLGGGSSLALPGRDAETGLRIPIPADLTPRALRGTVSTPAGVSRGFIDVRQNDRLLSRTPLPREAPGEIVLPLGGLTVDRQRGSAAVVISSHLEIDGFCSEDPGQALRIGEPQVTYSGTETQPSSVGEFLPPMLSALTITVPDDVKPAEAEAAVRLATSVAARYGSAPVDITARTQPRDALRPARGGPLSRQVLISTDLAKGLHIQNDSPDTYLTIGGTEADLATQASFLTADLSPIAMAPGVIAGQFRAVPQLARDVQTLGDIGVANQRTVAEGWPRLTVGIDQTRLARPSKNVRVQLRGSYTPPTGPGGRLLVSIDDRVIGSWPADESGVFDDWVQIPNDELHRFTELTVTAEYSGTRARCGDADLATLTLDASGEIEAEAADPPWPGGFQSLPQALMPRVQLGWTNGDGADVARAVTILTHLQQLSSVRLGVDVGTAAETASSAHPAILIAADGTGIPEAIELPVKSSDGTLTVADGGPNGPQTLALEPDTGYGALQVLREGARTVLVATSAGNAVHLDQLLAWMDSSDRWATASGVAVLRAPGQEPVVVAGELDSESSDPSHNALLWAVIAVGSVIVVAGAAFWVLRRRRL